MRLGSLGKKHMEVGFKWIPSLAAFGSAGAALVCYATEWKQVLEYLPYYNGKYREQ